jgi:hypothetical protein
VRYFDDPVHAAWQAHYFEGQYGAWHLAVNPAWGLANLHVESKRGSDDYYRLRVEYRDATDGALYERHIYTAWEDVNDVWFPGFDEDWNPLNAGRVVRALMAYWYGQHHCPCHRKQDAREAGAVTDDECEGDRFQIRRIWDPAHPNLILYSETMDAAELEQLLAQYNQPGVQTCSPKTAAPSASPTPPRTTGSGSS